ncbi:polypyrimidine tract-binding protein homolog 3 [Tanacetum coccineum]
MDEDDKCSNLVIVDLHMLVCVTPRLEPIAEPRPKRTTSKPLQRERELLRSRPTTLGEANSLARITEACYEDERPTIANAKPNDLTARVQVQDLEQTTQGRGDEPNRILLVTIHHMLYPITMEVLHQVFSPHGGDDSETSGLVTPAEEVADSGHSSTLSSLVEHGRERTRLQAMVTGRPYRGYCKTEGSPEKQMGNVRLGNMGGDWGFPHWGADASASYGDGSAVPGVRRITGGSHIGMDAGLLIGIFSVSP